MGPAENRAACARVPPAASRLRAVDASRIAWLTTVAICVITAVILLVSGYLGYFGVLLAIALAAAINLR